MVAHACIAVTGESKAGGLQVPGYPQQLRLPYLRIKKG